MIAHRLIWTIGFLAIFLTYRRIYREDRKRPVATLDSRLSVESFRPAYLLVFHSSAAICMASACGWNALLDSPGIRDAGQLLALTGTGLAWWAKQSLGAAYSPCYASVLPPRLIARGPYRWVRHPLRRSRARVAEAAIQSGRGQ